MSRRISILLSARERTLLRKYAFPFEELHKALEDCRQKRSPLPVETTELEWEQAIGNLSISINEGIGSESLLEELDLLATDIEKELQ